MFPLPYAAPFARLLYALFGLDILLLFSGLAFGRMAGDGSGRLPLPVRMALSAILVVVAFGQWQLARAGAAVAGYARWVFLGMACGFLGDLIMARLIPVPNRLIFGMLAFGLGHIIYVIALAALAVALGLWEPALGLPVWALAAAAATVLWYTWVQKPGGARALNCAALVYSLLMATLNAFAASLALREARFIPLVVGAALFLVSDLVLGHWNIRGHAWKRVNDVVWLTYNLGQMLIVLSVAAAGNVAL